MSFTAFHLNEGLHKARGQQLLVLLTPAYTTLHTCRGWCKLVLFCFIHNILPHKAKIEQYHVNITFLKQNNLSFRHPLNLTWTNWEKNPLLKPQSSGLKQSNGNTAVQESVQDKGIHCLFLTLDTLFNAFFLFSASCYLFLSIGLT